MEMGLRMKQKLLEVDKEFLLDNIRKDKFLKVSGDLDKLKSIKPESIK